MRKEDNCWGIGETKYDRSDEKWYTTFSINGEKYPVNTTDSALVHAVLLLVDAINDKKI